MAVVIIAVPVNLNQTAVTNPLTPRQQQNENQNGRAGIELHCRAQLSNIIES